MSVIKWEEPPPSRANTGGVKRSKWAKIGQSLRERPGQWAHVDTKANMNLSAQIAAFIRNGKCAKMPAGEFEAVSRSVNGEYRVYARYVGEVTS